MLLLEFRHVSRWRRHALASTCSSTHTALHRAGAVGERCGRKRKLPCLGSYPGWDGRFNPTHLGPCRTASSVQQQRLVQERVVAVHESHGALVLARPLEKQAGLLHHRAPLYWRHLREQSGRTPAGQSIHLQPLSAETVVQRPRARSFSIVSPAPTTPRLLQRARSARAASSASGGADHK